MMLSSFSLSKFTLYTSPSKQLQYNLETWGLPWWLSEKRNCLPVLETQVQSLDWEDPLEKEMATHSSMLAWEVLWAEEAGGLQFMGSDMIQRLNNSRLETDTINTSSLVFSLHIMWFRARRLLFSISLRVLLVRRFQLSIFICFWGQKEKSK